MKKTGKALSLVLSLALVVSSLTTTFASASAASETATAKLAKDTVYLCNGGGGSQLKAELVDSSVNGVANYFDLDTVGNGELYDHQKVTNLVLKDVAITGSNGIATLKVTKNSTTGNVTSAVLTLTNANAQGELTVAGRYEGTVQRGTNTTNSNVYAQASLKVVVLRKGSTVIGKATKDAATGDVIITGNGAYPDSLDKLPKTPGESIDGMVEQVAPASASALAKWTRLNIAQHNNAASAANNEYVLTPSGVGVAVTTTAAAQAFNIETLPANGSAAPTRFSSTGTVSLSAVVYKSANPNGTGAIAASTNALDRATAATSIINKIVAKPTDDTISVYNGVTYLASGSVASDTAKNSAVNVAGCDIDLSGAATTVTMAGGTVGKLTLGANELDVNNGTITGGIETSGKIVVSKGSVNSITENGSTKEVFVNGGTIGDITDKSSSGAVINVISTDEAVPVTVGNITAKNITVDSNGCASVKTGNLKASPDATITLKGDKVVVGQIDCDYRNVTLSLEGFKGSIAAPTNDYTPGLNSSPVYTTLSVSNGTTMNSDATVTGNPFFYSVNLTAGTLTFSGSAKIGDIGVSGSGTLQVAPNTLYTQGNISGINLKMTKDFKEGDTVFSADTGKVYVGSFNPVGYTVEKVAASTSVDAFKVKTVVFAGLQITGSKVIELNKTENYVASPYPTTTSLPANEKVTWDFSGNSNYLTATVDPNDGNKISVKAIKQDPTFNSLNQGTLTATIVDAYGFRDYSYEPVTLDVAIGTKPSSFTIDSLPKTMKAGEQYTVKITSSDGTAPKTVFADGFAVITKTTTSGKATFVTFTAKTAGEHGVYVSGTKVAIIKVAGSICDTTTVTKKAGQPYTFKVTSPKAPTFVVAGIGSIKPSKVIGHDYYYMVKATTNKGVHGVYVNGAAIALYTFA